MQRYYDPDESHRIRKHPSSLFRDEVGPATGSTSMSLRIDEDLRNSET
jgi:hypothetical protein